MSAPVGWPSQLPPPGSSEWQERASAWLFDLCPGEYRSYELLRRHPVILARLAHAHINAAIVAAREGWTRARVELKELVDPATVDGAISMYEREGARLAALLREVSLVETALADHASRQPRA
jgi:hypothetical protein